MLKLQHVIITIIMVLHHAAADCFLNKKTHFESTIFQSIREIELKTQTFCENQVLIPQTNKNGSDLIDCWAVIVTAFSAPKFVFSLTHKLNYGTRKTDKLVAYPAKTFSFCRNILVPLSPGFTQNGFEEIADRASDFGKINRDRYIFIHMGHNLRQTPLTAIKSTLGNILFKYIIVVMKNETLWDVKAGGQYMSYFQKMFDGHVVASAVSTTAPVLSLKLFNLQGRHLTVVSSNLPPYLWRDKRTGQLHGAHYQLLRAISTTHNCSFTFKTGGHIPTGIKLPNGSWTGMMGGIVHGDADLAAMMGINQIRYEAAEFTQFLHQDVMKFGIAHPKLLVKWDALFSPFKLTLWILITFTFVIFVPLFYFHLFYYQTMNSVKIGSIRKRGNSVSSLLYISVMIPFGLAIEQGVVVLKKPQNIRFIAILWLIFTLITGIAYKSHLVGFLSFPNSENIPRSFHDLYLRTGYTLVFNYLGGAGFILFNYSTSEVYKSLTRRFVHQRSSDKCIVQAAMDQKTVCIGWNLVLNNAMSNNLTLFPQFDPILFSTDIAGYAYVGVALRKNSIYTETFTRITSEMRDAGLMQKWLKDISDEDKKVGKEWFSNQRDSPVYKHMKNTLNVMQNKENHANPLNLQNVSCVLLIFLFGIITSCLAVLVELFYPKYIKDTKLFTSRM